VATYSALVIRMNRRCFSRLDTPMCGGGSFGASPWPERSERHRSGRVRGTAPEWFLRTFNA
jgi:hypothetical protein